MTEAQDKDTGPKGWEVITGTMGTDFAPDPTVVDSGSVAFKFLATAVATELKQHWIPVGNSEAVYMVEAVLRAESIAGGNIITVDVEKFESDKTTSKGTTTINNAVLTAVDTWETFGAVVDTNGAEWLRVRILKSATAFAGWVDRVDTRPLPRGLTAKMSSITQAISTGSITPITFNSAVEHGITIETSTPTGVITIPVGGRYMITTMIGLESMSDGDRMSMYLALNGSTERLLAERIMAGAGHSYLTGSAQMTLAAGDTIEIEIDHDHGSNLNIADTSPSASAFSRVEVTEWRG